MDNESFSSICYSVAAILIMGLVVFGLIKGCQISNEFYQKSYSECITAGGSFIPAKGSNNEYICLRK